MLLTKYNFLSRLSMKELTRKTSPMSFDERIEKVIEVSRGWLNYFKYASIKQKLIEVDGWLRNRLRYCIWTNWKKPERKRKNLIRLGIPQGQAYAWSRTRMGGWAVALRRSLHECLKNIIFMRKVRYLAPPSHWNVSKGGDIFHYTTFINYCLTLITNTPYFL